MAISEFESGCNISLVFLVSNKGVSNLTVEVAEAFRMIYPDDEAKQSIATLNEQVISGKRETARILDKFKKRFNQAWIETRHAFSTKLAMWIGLAAATLLILGIAIYLIVRVLRSSTAATVTNVPLKEVTSRTPTGQQPINFLMPY